MKPTILQFEIGEGQKKRSFSEIITELQALSPGMWEVEIRKPKRTKLQNRALHKFFHNIVVELHGVGAVYKYISVITEQELEMEWDDRLVKEMIWRPVQIAITGKESSTSLTTAEVDKVAKPIMKLLKKKFGFGLLFPSQLSKQLEKDSKQMAQEK